jgi:hypothetical protein
MKKSGPKISITKPIINRVGKNEIAPNFNSLFGDPPFEKIPNPMDGKYGDNVQNDVNLEISETLKLFLEAKKERRDAWRLKVDTEYWFAVCFQSREQKNEFLEKMGIIHLGDKYIDGLKLSEKLGVPIKPINLPKRNPPKLNVILKKVPIIKKGGE